MWPASCRASSLSTRLHWLLAPGEIAAVIAPAGLAARARVGGLHEGYVPVIGEPVKVDVQYPRPALAEEGEGAAAVLLPVGGPCSEAQRRGCPGRRSGRSRPRGCGGWRFGLEFMVGCGCGVRQEW